MVWLSLRVVLNGRRIFCYGNANVLRMQQANSFNPEPEATAVSSRGMGPWPVQEVGCAFALLARAGGL